MSNKIYFMNNGDFDVRAMLTMGVSVKDNQDAIGFFGTGFKYAVAIILRMRGSVSINTVSGEYVFEARREKVRGKEFDIVYMNGREAGFTTHLGTNWEPWMAFRELYCNATDEGGEASTERNDSYDTVIEVDCAEIARAYHRRSDYFLSGTPIVVGEQAEVYEGSGQFIYFRGIAVCNAYENSLYTYNITRQLTLTEDRTAKNEYEYLWPIRKAIQRSNNVQMLRKCLRSGDHAEARIGFDKDWGVSSEFLGVCAELIKSDAGLCESARRLASQIQAEAGDWPEFEPSGVQKKMLDRAIRFLAKMDVDVTRFQIKTVNGLGNEVMGRALDGVIYLSEIPFNMGTKQVASTLLEEWVHNKYGCEDFDRKMQSWLFDKILSLGESMNGEPL